MRGSLVAATALWGAALAAPLHAFRVEFVALCEQQRLEGAEVCFFPAARLDDPYSRFLASDDVRCLPADHVVEITPGRWNYFVRHANGFISAHPTVITQTEPYIAEWGFRRIAVSLRPAGRLDFTSIRSELDAGTHLAVYYPNPNDGFGSAVHPVPRGENSMLVPADVPVVPLVVRNGMISSVLGVLTVARGSTVSVEQRQRAGDALDVVFWVKLVMHVVPEKDLREITASVQLAAYIPGGTLKPHFDPPAGAAAHMSLQFLSDAPVVPYEIALHGDTWEEYRMTPTGTREGSVFNVLNPILAAPAALVKVNLVNAKWPGRNPFRRRVGLPILPDEGIAIRLLSCSAIANGSSAPPRGVACRTVHEVVRAGTTTTFRAVTAGRYVLAVRTSRGHETRIPVYAPPGKEARVDVQVNRKLRGRISPRRVRRIRPHVRDPVVRKESGG